MRTQAGSALAWALLPAVVLFAMLWTFSAGAAAQPNERQGKEVVDAACGACHTSGKDNAPRIGDAKAWAKRVSRGLTGLTNHALMGIRKMPAHGNKGLSDIEIKRAIVYMVNQSGGNWVEPVGGFTHGRMRTGETIVKTRCAKCHQAGRDGAPMIGDRPAWTSRLAKGLDRLVTSAVQGHGPMPSRGALPDLSNEEIRGAIVYMFNHGLPAISPPPPAAAADSHHKLVSGIDIYFGMMGAEAMRAAQAHAKSGEAKVNVPSGRGYYHVNISLADNKSQMPLTDAKVTMRISDGMTVQAKPLDMVVANNAVSYGGFFHFSRNNAYNIAAEIRRPGLPGSSVANFEFKAP